MTDEARVEEVDWDEVDRSVLGAGLVLRLLPFLALAAAFAYDYYYVDGALVLTWNLSRMGWLTVFAMAVFGVGFVAPMARRPQLVRRRLGELLSDRAAMVALAILAVFVFAAVIQPFFVEIPDTDFSQKYQPPAFTVPDGRTTPVCKGHVTENLNCRGSLEHPLGTNDIGQDMLALLTVASHVSMRFAFVVSAIMVPLAVGVGTVAGYVGGRTDDALMRYVDVQQSVPAFLIYIVVGYITRFTIFNVALVFGLFSWGSLARLVRSEVLQRKQSEYVLAARNAGASHLAVIRRHVLPNVSGTIVTGLTLQIPTLVLTETVISFLKFGDIDRITFGSMLRRALGIYVGTPGSDAEFVVRDFLFRIWWTSATAVVALVLLVVAFNVLGDALRDVLDPRQG